MQSAARAVPTGQPPEAEHTAAPDPRGVERFPRGARLVHRRDYERIFASAVRSGDDGLTVLAAPNREGAARLGLAVSKREIRSAVRRNRIKRCIRESFRRRRHEFAGLDIVVVVKRAVDTRSWAAIDASLARHLSSVKRKCAG